MKLSLMRPALVLALALGLASCGGGKAGFDVAGSISGLKYSGLELSTNGMTINPSAPTDPSTVSTEFKFPNQIEYGEVYDVQITKQPDHQQCAILSYGLGSTGTNTAGRLEKINVLIECALATKTIGGKVVGLTSKGLVLANGSTGGTVSPTPETPAFVFPAIPYGQTYGITVLTQPHDPKPQTCTVISNGVGTMGDKEVTDVVVDCAPAAA
jgi:hypothetical protein